MPNIEFDPTGITPEYFARLQAQETERRRKLEEQARQRAIAMANQPTAEQRQALRKAFIDAACAYATACPRIDADADRLLAHENRMRQFTEMNDLVRQGKAAVSWVKPKCRYR